MIATSRWLRTGPAFTQFPTTTGIADLRYYNAEFREWGAGAPLVLVPGLAGGIELVEPFARQLAQRFRVIAFQSRGENDCFALRRRFNLRDLSDDLNEFIRWRGLERPLVVGISFGAVVAIKFAAQYPESLSALTLQGMGMRFESGLVQRIADMVLSSYPIPKNNSFFNQFFGLLFGHRPTPEQLQHVVRTCWQTDQSVMTRRLRLLRRLNLGNELPQIRVPTLVVGGQKDILVSSANSRELVAGLRDGEHAIIPRAGHLAPISHAAQTSDIISDFVSSVEV